MSLRDARGTIGRWTVAELAGALSLLAWRVAASPLSALWRDAVAILAVYWIITALASKTRLWPSVTAAAAAFLLGIYVQGQVPHVLSVLRLGP